MRASEWQYLCAVHEPPKACCALDYSCHTLDWAAYTLTSQRHFPSRLTLSPQEGLADADDQDSGVKQLTNIVRRVYRIYSHAWFSHRSVFWDVEGREGLHLLFKTVTDEYELMPEESYTIPPEAEALSDDTEALPERKVRGALTSEGPPLGPGATQRRHKATPSLGSTVTIIHETDEPESEAIKASDSAEKS